MTGSSPSRRCTGAPHSCARTVGRASVPPRCTRRCRCDRGGHSWLEREFLDLLSRHGLPLPTMQVVLSVPATNRACRRQVPRITARGRTARLQVASHHRADEPRCRAGQRAHPGRIRTDPVHLSADRREPERRPRHHARGHPPSSSDLRGAGPPAGSVPASNNSDRDTSREQQQHAHDMSLTRSQWGDERGERSAGVRRPPTWGPCRHSPSRERRPLRCRSTRRPPGSSLSGITVRGDTVTHHGPSVARRLRRP